VTYDAPDDFAEPLLWPALWRHKWRIAAVTIAFGVVGYAASSLQGDVYTARAEVVLIDPASAGEIDVGGPRGGRYVAGQAEIAGSGAVAAVAGEVLGVSAAEVVGSVSVTPASSADQLIITASRSTAADAAAYANAVADGYRSLRSERVVADAERIIEQLEAEITSARTDLEELAAASAAGDAGAEEEVDAATSRISTLQARVSELRVDASVFGSGVLSVNEAVAPRARTSPSPRRDALLAAAIGLILAAGVAWWRYMQTPVAEDRQDPAAALDAPLLGEVPVFDRSKDRPHIAEEGSPAAFAFEFVLGTLGFALNDLPAPTVVVTSALPGDGKTLIALNLAAAARADGRKPLLVDADERVRGLTLLTDAEDAIGLTDLVSSTDHDLSDATQEVAIGGFTLSMLTAGTPPADTAGFFRSPGFRELMTELRGRADITIIDTPPLLAVAETANIASQGDGVVVVVDRGTPMRALNDVKERADLADLRIIGYIFNRAKAGDRYGYGAYGKARA